MKSEGSVLENFLFLNWEWGGQPFDLGKSSTDWIMLPTLQQAIGFTKSTDLSVNFIKNFTEVLDF